MFLQKKMSRQQRVKRFKRFFLDSRVNFPSTSAMTTSLEDYVRLPNNDR